MVARHVAAPARSISLGQASTILRRLGWRIRSSGEARSALRSFQTGYALGAALKIDGVLGPVTSAALLRSEAARRAGTGTASAHFSFAQFACKCGGRYSTCARIKVQRSLLVGLERYRQKAGPTSIVSGYRCPSHNHAVGGATSSQHLWGAAADVDYRLSDRQVAALGVFSGIGRSERTHLVRHVDRRDASGHNLTSGSTRRPTVWNYAR